MSIHPEHSQNEQVTASESAHVNINRFTLPRDPGTLIVASLLALSVAVNIWCGWVIRDIGTRKWLHDWDLNQFQMTQFAELKNRVDVDDKIIQMFPPQQCKR